MRLFYHPRAYHVPSNVLLSLQGFFNSFDPYYNPLRQVIYAPHFTNKKHQRSEVAHCPMARTSAQGWFKSSGQVPGPILWTTGLFLAVSACFHISNSEKGLITGNLSNLLEADFSLGFCFCVTHRSYHKLYWVGKQGELVNRLQSENVAFKSLSYEMLMSLNLLKN